MNKRKTLSPMKESNIAPVDFLYIDDMVLKVKGKAYVFYFSRFQYKGVPNIENKGGGNLETLKF